MEGARRAMFGPGEYRNLLVLPEVHTPIPNNENARANAGGTKSATSLARSPRKLWSLQKRNAEKAAVLNE
jgi:hypothetical protein